jgi:BirA family biotin operon repressor/biotin-[acetyl-CoA-carboxylase] ligase
MLLDIEHARQTLANCLVGHTLDYHRKLTSTMARARELLAASSTQSGAVVIAEEQSAGRGRHQRRWEAPAGRALLCSFLLKPPLPVVLAQLPMLAGLVVLRTLQAFAPQVRGRVGLKWPNDILLGDTPVTAGKVAGILIETSASSPTDLAAIVGIGLNVNQTAAELPPGQPGAPSPTSLRLYLQGYRTPVQAWVTPGATGVRSTAEDTPLLDRTALLIQLCRTFGELLAEPPPAPTLWATWRNALWTLHQPVVIREHADPASPVCIGQAVDVTPTGDLIVITKDGERRRFAAGDVSLRQV